METKRNINCDFMRVISMLFVIAILICYYNFRTLFNSRIMN